MAPDAPDPGDCCATGDCHLTKYIHGCHCEEDPFEPGYIHCKRQRARLCEGNCDGGQCRIGVTLTNPIVSRGQNLNITIMIQHNRIQTVTTAIYMAIYDQTGNIFYSFQNENHTFEYGDMIHVEKIFTIPDSMTPGTYYLKVGVGEMKQGAIQHAAAFQVIQ